MKIIAKSRTQVRGYGVVQLNETIDLDEALIDERIKANFSRADGKEWEEVKSEGEGEGEGEEKKSSDVPPTNSNSKKQLIERTAERMGREAIIAALDAAHVAYKTNENTNSLAKKYLRSIGQEVD